MKLSIEISDSDAADIRVLLDQGLHGDGTHGTHNSHGTLTLEVLAQMLLQDVALAHRRPGSWEGAGMLNILSSHGYIL
jgi:hypothetical protein